MSAADVAPVETAPEPAAETPAPAKARTPDDDFDDLLKKSGGFEYAKGKKIDSAANLKRMLGKVSSTDSVAAEAVKVKQAEAERKATIDGLAKMKPQERISALEKLGIPRALVLEALEEDVLAWDAKQKEQAGMSERERQQARQLEERDNELKSLRQERERAEAEQKEQAFIAETEGLRQELEQAAIGGFTRAGITNADKPLIHAILPAIAEAMDRAKRLGLPLDPDDIAEVATKERAKLSDDWNAARPIDDLKAALAGMEAEDPGNPGRKTTRLKLLMASVAADIRASRGGVPGDPVRPVATAPARKQEQPDDGAKFRQWLIRK